MDLLLQGLQLSLVGITVTFSALGLFILIIVLLQRLFGQESGSAPPEAMAGDRALDSRGARAELEIAAAIASALEHLHLSQIGPSTLGQTLGPKRGAWWSRQTMLTPPKITHHPSRSDEA